KNTTFLMTHSRPKYLVGCLNSSLINWYFDTICASSGTGTNRWIKIYVEQLPVPIITPERSLLASNIERLIESVITQKKSNSDITSLEKQIDQLVYQLYDLTPEEIAIVERANMK
ncbi:TaqI-like C-terminal specificity domain-containing protein, partial [Aminobacterium mobile]|uniref:TaqI-like C-terminal specificity domain-containing protein n=1 Tax=Aminobacterium mobile TaxID=81467 RepID=UPI003314BF53